jgi:hypothetical protein
MNQINSNVIDMRAWKKEHEKQELPGLAETWLWLYFVPVKMVCDFWLGVLR